VVQNDYFENYVERFEKVYDDPTHPSENLRLIKLFLKKVEHKGVSRETLKANYATMTVFSKWCTRPIKELDELDILEFFDYMKNYRYVRRGQKCQYSPMTIHTHKIVVNKFLKSIGKNEFFELFKEKINKKKKIRRETLLTPDEVDLLIEKGATHERDKAIIATLFESGARSGELLSCRIQDVKFDSAGCKLHVPEGKTGDRTIRLVFASQYLRRWLQNHPQNAHENSENDAYLFISLQRSQNDNGEMIYDVLSHQGLWKQLRCTAEKVGIKKRVNPHSFRHSCASMLADQMKEQPLKAHMGWTAGSDMLNIYVHDPDSENAMLEMYDIKPLETEAKKLKVNRCPRCSEINRKKNIYCWRCGMEMVVDYATAQKLANIFEMAEGIVKDPYSLEGIEAGLKKLQDFLASQPDISCDKEKAEKEEHEEEDEEQ
jgi:integrase/recombinase XerD